MTERPVIELEPSTSPGLDSDELVFIGTATVLLRVGGFTVLTDPNFLHRGDHAKLGYGLRSKRLTEPAMTISELPPLDLIVLSHHHGDHFDEVAARELRKDVPIVTTAHAARKLTAEGFTAPLALATWQSQAVVRGDARLQITAMPGKHGPRPLDALLPPVMGSMLELTRPDQAPLRIYVTGDTLLHDALEEIPRRYPDIDLALIHLGGTRIAGVLLTMNADQGVRALQLIRPRTAVPIHYHDYTVFKEPLDEFGRAAASASLPTEIRYVERGVPHRLEASPRS
ncbi:MAG: MBL fold metallo-hydrolase [Actinobacteria bacterium]|nr:MBL fold metallo-hydrolase [Actinomycetota bacterium]